MRILLLMSFLLLSGCRREPAENVSEKKASRKEPSVGVQVVDGVTGRKKVQNFQETKLNIKKAEEAQKKRFEKIPKF